MKDKVKKWFESELSMCIEESLDAIECEDIMHICLKAFNELEQYKALGTVEELKEAKEQFDNINSCANSVALCGLCDFETAKESVISTIKAMKDKAKCDGCAGCTVWKCDDANIRAKAVDEFAKALHLKEFDNEYGTNIVLTPKDVDEIAEQLKAGGNNERFN